MITRLILLATNIFPPDIGGPASFIPDLASELAELGYPVTVACQSDSATDASDAGRSYRVHRIKRMKYRLNSVWAYANLLYLVPQADLIFCNTLEQYLEPVCRLLNRSYVLKIVGDAAWI